MSKRRSLGDWRTIENEKEKYQAYLCSREWSEKREAVRERAKGRCERCSLLQMDAVHHLTYARKYKEDLEDLQAICNQCHSFTHGKHWFDPKGKNRWWHYLTHCRNFGYKIVPIYLVVNYPIVNFCDEYEELVAIRWLHNLEFEMDMVSSNSLLLNKACIQEGSLDFNFAQYLDLEWRSPRPSEDPQGFFFMAELAGATQGSVEAHVED